MQQVWYAASVGMQQVWVCSKLKCGMQQVWVYSKCGYAASVVCSKCGMQQVWYAASVVWEEGGELSVLKNVKEQGVVCRKVCSRERRTWRMG